MLSYIIRRLLLIIPTILGIMLINYVIINGAPGGPIDQIEAELRGVGGGAAERAGGGKGGDTKTGGRDGKGESGYARSSLDPAQRKELEKQLNLDKPHVVRFLLMAGNYFTFDFGNSFLHKTPVIDLILDKLPVSISLGLWTTLLIYLISIPLGIAKATRDGARFDVWTSFVIVFANAVPSFMFGLMLLVFFATGSYWAVFPLKGLVSENWDQLSLLGQIGDYFWHIALPVFSLTIGGFATLTLLTKNSFIEEVNKLYVLTARSKGLTQRRVLYGHVFRNAMLVVIAGFPGAFIGIFFTGSLLIEVLFSLDGLGLLGFTALETRDYPLLFATLFMFSLIGLLVRLISDLTYVLVDPRIDFEGLR